MKMHSSLTAVISTALLLAAGAPQAEDDSENGAADSVNGVSVAGGFTPKLYYFDYFEGYGDERVQFLEQYNWQEGFTGDRRSDFYLDADLNLVISSPERNLFTLERVGFGPYNHRGNARADTDKIAVMGFYRNFRTATGGIDYLFNPNAVLGGTDPLYFPPGSANANTGYAAQFNDDSNRSIYKVDRTTYGAGVLLKPAMLGDYASLKLGYDGYRRSGNNFQTYVLGAGDVRQAGTNAQIPERALQRWRGFNEEVDEYMNRVSMTFAASPVADVQLAYDVSFEKFHNQAPNYTHADIVLPEGFQYNASDPDALTHPLGFIPDSSLMTHGLRLSKTLGQVALAGGYGYSSLEQDSFTVPQQELGYSTGKITTDNAFFNFNANLTSSVGLEGFIKYYNRDNDSSYPVPGLIDGAEAEDALGVRLNNLESLTYGLAANFRTRFLKSTITPGWEHLDKERDLTWVTYDNGGIRDERSLLNEDTKSDEVYVRFVTRPTSGLTLRLTPFYQWADETGLPTEPETSYGFRGRGSYVLADNATLSGYYNYKREENNNNTLTDNVVGGDADTFTQDVQKDLHSAGLSLNVMPTEWINTFATLSWIRDDYETYFFSSNRRRFEPVTSLSNSLFFALRDRPGYSVDTYVFSLGGDWQYSDLLRLDGTYTFSHSKGDTASGIILTELPEVDGRIDNSVHTIALGVDYELSKSMRLRASWTFDYYDDEVYGDLTGGVNTVMAGVHLGF
jgi:hypothetical protein